MDLPQDYDRFLTTLHQESAPQHWHKPLQAMWYDAKGDWHNAHELAQDVRSEEGSWVHAYLHRKEGDDYNARYWYTRANRTFPSQSLEQEHREIVDYFLLG